MNSNNQSRALDFKDDLFSIGMDVHKDSWTISVVRSGIMVKTLCIECNIEKMLYFLHKSYPGGAFQFCYEAGFCGFWIQRCLSIEGYNCIVINPADVPSSQKEKYTKSDTIDSRKLARELDNNNLNPIYVPEIEEEALRDIYRYRTATVKKQTAVKNQIKSFLHKYGIKIPSDLIATKWTKIFLKWLKNIQFDSLCSRIALDNYLEDLDYISSKVKTITKKLVDLITKQKNTKNTYKILRSAPGIGEICAVALISEIWNIKRFTNNDKFCAYIGLIPMTHSSGPKDSTYGITFRHKKKLRSMIIEASWASIRKDPALLLKYSELRKRMNSNKALVRVAKSLVKRIRYIWLNNCEYKEGLV